MPIELTRAQIERALPRVKSGLEKYAWLQEHLHSADLRVNRGYWKRFNHFYRVRRNQTWQERFYELLENKKRGTLTFGEPLRALHEATGRYEASFASKLVATIRPEMPVVDSIVLRNLDLTLPSYSAHDRAAKIERLYDTLISRFNDFVATDTGRYLIRRFHEKYPGARISDIKMVDFVLWQTRSGRRPHRTATGPRRKPRRESR